MLFGNISVTNSVLELLSSPYSPFARIISRNENWGVCAFFLLMYVHFVFPSIVLVLQCWNINTLS